MQVDLKTEEVGPEMKKLLFINNNLEMGGIQKSLVNLLNAIHGDYEITLLLFRKSGILLEEVPADIKVITPQKRYCALELTKRDFFKHPILYAVNHMLRIYARMFTRRKAMKLLGMFQKPISGYDAVISYSHLTGSKTFTNGCGDFVLDKTICNNKICWIHCDYLNSGYKSEENNIEYGEFDKIVCCSESVRKNFLKGTKLAESKTYALKNCYDFRIQQMAQADPYLYDDAFINVISVARLSSEKGIARGVEALAASKREDIRYYIVGDGAQKEAIQLKITESQMADRIFLLGEQTNPYGFMKNADYLLVPSIHEAAPMVFDEAKILGLNIITTNTTSALEMTDEKYDIVCENDLDGIQKAFSNLKKCSKQTGGVVSNERQKQGFKRMIES